MTNPILRNANRQNIRGPVNRHTLRHGELGDREKARQGKAIDYMGPGAGIRTLHFVTLSRMTGSEKSNR